MSGRARGLGHGWSFLVATALCLQSSAAHAQQVGDPGAHRERDLRLQLAQAQQEEADATSLWPVLLMGLGGSVGLGAGIAGIAISAGCDGDDCSASPAIGILVVSGVAVLTGGVIWWRRQLENLQKAQSARVMLERDLHYLKLSEPTPAPPPDALSARITLRF